MNPFLLNVLILIIIYAILATSLNLALGYAGLLNLGHIALFGIGAYTSALLTKAGISFPLAFIASGITAGFAGFVLFFTTRKLRGDYLALATLGFSFVTISLLLNLQSLTRGPLGIPGIARPSFGTFVFTSNEAYLLLVVLAAIVSIGSIALIVHSPFGRVLQAIRDDEIGVRVLGKNTTAIKGKTMALSAFFAGISGSLFAHYISFIEPYSFSLTEIILVLTIVIVGGLATLRGTIAATVIIVAIPELLRFVAIPSSVLGASRQILYALILLLILLYKPRGLWGRIDLA